ncbi:aminotransferase class V-fold PLP-dependent enzyme [Enterococcus sp. DIV1420a]|uniref:aminotransferase class V-fold PLP-dependent enzyme n=1 Tax=Enterococcus sp. DIV1420a TaxID=2774672 RepID=UPI003F2283CA
MNKFILNTINLEEAMKKQFQLVDCVTQNFKGSEILTRGDLGVVQGLNQPITTHKVEKVLKDFFSAQATMLVRGSGTMAIRLSLHAASKKYGKTVLLHDAPVYPTTQTSIDMLGLNEVIADFNQLDSIEQVINEQDVQLAIVQFTRQKPSDSYDPEAVIKKIKAVKKEIIVITDDNYSVLKVPNIGTECGADLSCFSTFKLLGPEGVGCIIGDADLLSDLREENYSGGLQVQGFEAISVLQGLIYAPVALAVSSQVSSEVELRLNAGEVKGVKQAFIANAQSKVIIVEFEQPIAAQVLEKAEELGASPNPVGAESKYEFVPMFYRLSATFRAASPENVKTMIRINPMRAGAETIIRIIKEAIERG